MKKQSAVAVDESVSPGLRCYLYFTAATTGAAIMVVEILGAKMLAPYIGTSHFVWTAQIAVTLVALACGYYCGGVMVDRSPKLGRLFGCILVAAVYLCLTLPVMERVAYWCLDFRLAIGSLLASAFLFFVPLALLAMTGPFLVRVLSHSVEGVGGNVGRLTAISTLGSFVGTILIGYVLVPFLPNSVTMFGTAAVLVLVVVVFFAKWGRESRAKIPLAAVGLFALLAGILGLMPKRESSQAQGRELFRSNSNFGQLQVIEYAQGADRRLIFQNDYLVQNTYDPAARQSISMFTAMLHGLARSYTARTDDVLCIGMGVGIVPMAFARDGARVDVVEINPAVVPIAQKFFDFGAKQMNVAIDDGRHFVNGSTKRYDAIILDAFLGDSSPTHLMSREAFAAMQRLLKPGGVLVLNCFGEFAPGKDFLAASLDKTLRAVFTGVRCHASGNGNVFFVAGDTAELKFVRAPDASREHELVRSSSEAAYSSVVEVDSVRGRVLTDNFNPVEFHDAANREQVRKQLASAMRRR